jgi:class 3 adenylate cyclase/tetratricopeptide (TPR) repeat protein
METSSASQGRMGSTGSFAPRTVREPYPAGSRRGHTLTHRCLSGGRHVATIGGAMTDVICPSCGYPSPPELRFCGSCGTRLERVCGSCGATSPATNRFCGSCGSALESGVPAGGRVDTAAAVPEATGEERKVVSVLFADLEASTELASRLDPEDLRAVLRPFFAAMMEEIERYGGTVEKFIGDAIVGVFGVPVAHEDDPERAVHTALAMQARLPLLNEQLATRAGGDLAMRIGVNTGDVLAAHQTEHEGYVVGEPVNVASRLQSLADPGTIVVGERTSRSTRRTFGYKQLADATVKGVRHPLAAWEVVPVGGAVPDPIRFRSPLVGRDAELGMLRLLLARTRTESCPNLVTVVGPPGIGKSRLAWAFADEARRQAVRVVGGRCPPYGEGLAYWPFGEVLKADAGILESDSPDVVLEKADAHLTPRFAGLDDSVGTTQVLLSSIGVVTTADPLAGSESTAAKRLIAGAWRLYFESCSALEPLVLLIEDIHWADDDLLELIPTLASRVTGQLLTLCTARPDLWERRSALSPGLPNTTTLTLAPLSTSEATLLVGQLLGGRMPEDVANRIVDRAEGNPFFASELVVMMTEDGTLERRGDGWALTGELPSALPDTVQAVIASRIDLLPADQKRAIQDAAVVGRTFWSGAVARLGSQQTESALDRLVDVGLVWEHEASVFAGERELMFNHILTRDVAYSSVPKARRVDAHASVMAWIEEATHGRDEELSEILCYHAREAADPARTARYAMLAGHRQRRVFAAEEAIRWYDEAVEAIGALEAGDHALLRAELTLSRGEAFEQLGRFGEARADYELALEATRSPEHPRPWLEARALAALAQAYWHEDRYSETEAVLPQAFAAAEAAAADDVTARLLLTSGSIALGKGDSRQALSLHERALEVAEQSGDRESEALARHALAETRLVTGSFEDGLSEARRADVLLRDLGQRLLVHRNEHVLSWHLSLTGRSDEAARVATSAADGARELGNRRLEAAALSAAAFARLSSGDPGSAARAADDSVRLAHEAGARRLELAARLWRALVLGELGALERLEEERRATAEVADELEDHSLRGPLLAIRAWSAAHAGDIEAARAAFDEAASQAAVAPFQLFFVGRIGILCWEWLGDAPGLEATVRQLEQVAEADGSPSVAWASFAAALAASFRDDHAVAAERAQSATAFAAAASEVPVEWRSHIVLGHACVALGRDAEAAVELRKAASILLPMVSGLEPGLRASFCARPDVARALPNA